MVGVPVPTPAAVVNPTTISLLTCTSSTALQVQFHDFNTSQGFPVTPRPRPAPIMTASSAPAAALLKRQLKEMRTSKDIPGISCGLVNDDNIFEWEVMLMISDDCKYYGGAAPLLAPFSGFPN